MKDSEDILNNPSIGCSDRNVGERLSIIGQWDTVAENVVGRIDNEKHIVMMMLVSDGDARR